MRKVNLVLSGGAMKGIAHVALLDKLKDLSIMPACISGSSSGALVAALYSAGLSGKEIIEFFKTTPLFKMNYMMIGKPGLFDSGRYIEILGKYLPKNFEELKVPINIAATNLGKNRVTYFKSGELLLPLIASCALPPIYSPVLINDEWYADGGIIDNFPISPFLQKDKYIIGSYVSTPSIRNNKDLNSTIKISNRATSLLIHAANAYKFNYSNYTIDYPLGSFSSFDANVVDEIFRVASKYLDDSENELIENFTSFESRPI